MDFSGAATCTCGKQMNQGGSQIGGPVAVSWRTCDCGIQAAFYATSSDREVYLSSKLKDHRERSKKLKKELLGCFEMASVDVQQSWDIKNGYGTGDVDWLLVKTDFGLVSIGWRKRVIEIDWSDIGFAFEIDEDVTKGSHFCHAWGYPKAVEAIKKLCEAITAASNENIKRG